MDAGLAMYRFRYEQHQSTPCARSLYERPVGPHRGPRPARTRRRKRVFRDGRSHRRNAKERKFVGQAVNPIVRLWRSGSGGSSAPTVSGCTVTFPAMFAEWILELMGSE